MACGAPNGRHPSVTCTREDGHPGLHQHNEGPYWLETPQRSRCLYARHDDKARCCLPRDHWESHRDVEGVQFPRRYAVQILNDALYKPDEDVLSPKIEDIDANWPATTLWERLLDP